MPLFTVQGCRDRARQHFIESGQPEAAQWSLTQLQDACGRDLDRIAREQDELFAKAAMSPDIPEHVQELIRKRRAKKDRQKDRQKSAHYSQEDLAERAVILGGICAKRADSWLQRWLSLHAARDAAHMADPAADALGSKLGGPLSLGLAEAVNNHFILGNTTAERKQSLRDAVSDVKDESYSGSLQRGLKSAPTYAAVGAGVGGLAPVVKSFLAGQPVSGRHTLVGAGTGAATGAALAVLRPLLQKAILDRTSAKSQRNAIDLKAKHPVLTALPFGDAIAAATR